MVEGKRCDKLNGKRAKETKTEAESEKETKTEKEREG